MRIIKSLSITKILTASLLQEFIEICCYAHRVQDAFPQTCVLILCDRCKLIISIMSMTYLNLFESDKKHEQERQDDIFNSTRS